VQHFHSGGNMSVEQKQPDRSVKERQTAAVNLMETWPLGDYYWNMIRYAKRAGVAFPRLDLTINGKLLFRLQIAEEDDEEESSDGERVDGLSDAAEKTVSYEFTLKYFGEQSNFARHLDTESARACTFRTLDDAAFSGDDEEQASGSESSDFDECALDATFDYVLEDKDAVSGLCYAASFPTISRSTVKTILGLVQTLFCTLEAAAKTDADNRFSSCPVWSIERLFYDTTHDAYDAAYETKAKSGTDGDDKSADGTTIVLDESAAEFEREISALETQESTVGADESDAVTVSSCQLDAEIWQHNQAYGVTVCSRHYQNLVSVDSIEDRMHAAFRGPPDDLQKPLYVAEYLIEYLRKKCFEQA